MYFTNWLERWCDTIDNLVTDAGLVVVKPLEYISRTIHLELKK